MAGGLQRRIPPNYLAIDSGAESGRVTPGSLAADKLSLKELHRFANQPVHLPWGRYWDAFRLHHEVVEGPAIAGPVARASVGR
jgi:hypothetical protein